MKGIHEEKFSGECLGARGIPDRGTVLIDYDAEPRLLDLVLCDGPAGSICGFMKELVQTGTRPIVRTRYKDSTRDYMFLSPTIMGVAVEVRDEKGNVVYRRKGKTRVDEIRAMSDEELANMFIQVYAEGFLSAYGHEMDEDEVYQDEKKTLEWLRQEIDE